MRELGIDRIEVHVAGVCVAWTEQGSLRVLALRRAGSKQLFPMAWEGVGGQVRAGESLDDALSRHLLEEAGLQARRHYPTMTYVIEPNGSGATERIPGLRFLCEVPFVDPELDPLQHIAFRWLRVDELSSVAWIPDMLPQVIEAVATVLGDAS